MVASAVVKRASGLLVLAWAFASTGVARAQMAPAAPAAPDRLSVGDWRLVPVVEVRVSGEGRHDLDGADHGSLVERARLGAEAERGPVGVRLVLQDARVWNLGAGSAPLGQPGGLAQTGAYEAWVDAHTDGARPDFLRVGRQAVTWGEGRLLGASDGSPTGRTLDAARARLVLGDWGFEVLGASLSDPQSTTGAAVPQAYGELAGGRVEWAFDPLLAVEAYGLLRWAQDQPVSALEDSVKGSTYTAALAAHGDTRAWSAATTWSWGAEGALQLGHADALALDRLAWAGAAHVGASLDRVLLRPSMRLSGSVASGADGGSKYAAFDPLLPDVHTLYGAMDLFAWSNVVEASARVAIEPLPDATASIEYRYVRQEQAGGAWRNDYLATVATPAGNAGGKASAELGHEIDASMRWSPWTPVELALGYSLLVVGDGARGLLAAEHVFAPDLAHMGFGKVTLRLP